MDSLVLNFDELNIFYDTKYNALFDYSKVCSDEVHTTIVTLMMLINRCKDIIRLLANANDCVPEYKTILYDELEYLCKKYNTTFDTITCKDDLRKFNYFCPFNLNAICKINYN